MNEPLVKFLNFYNINTLDDLKNAIVLHSKELSIELVYQAAEFLNPNRETTAAYYTDRSICRYIFKSLPDFDNQQNLNVLEPAVGAGSFLPYIAEKYKNKKFVEITVIDVDIKALEIAELIFETYYREKYPNVAIRHIHDDYLFFEVSNRKYDLIIGNPPYSKIKDKIKSLKYKKRSGLKKTSNLFALFLEKALNDARIISLIIPKSFLNAPEYDELRCEIKKKRISSILDFGENGFKGVKIETINIVAHTEETLAYTHVESLTQGIRLIQAQEYITDSKFPSWILYRDEHFDKFADTLELGMFKAFRDRQIVNKHLSSTGKTRVLKSRNIGDNKIQDIVGYDKYIDDIGKFFVSKYLNDDNIVLVPNLSYSPRACFLPKNTIADGSVAMLINQTAIKIAEQDLSIFATDEFKRYYRVARNYGTRSLNIDNNSVYFFGIRRKQDEVDNRS